MPYLENIPRNPGGTLIFAHGAGAPMDSDFMNSLAEALCDVGVSVIRFEFPYMAQRREDGKKRPPNRAPVLLESFQQVIADISSRENLTRPLLIGGKSMGGRIASMLSELPEVDGVCCFGYPFHPPGKPEKLAERIVHLQTSETPIRIFQGTRDPFGKPGGLAALEFSPAVQIEWLEDGDHDLKPRKASGLTQRQHLKTMAERVAAFVNVREHLIN